MPVWPLAFWRAWHRLGASIARVHAPCHDWRCESSQHGLWRASPMAQHASFFFAILNREYFESLELYAPGPQYLELAQRHVDATWELKRGGYWTRFQPKDVQCREQGWKIHLSASEHTAEQVLERTLPVLVKAR